MRLDKPAGVSGVLTLAKAIFSMCVYWRAERAHLVVQLARDFHIYVYMYVSDHAFWPWGCPRATRKCNRPCLFHSPSMRSIQLLHSYCVCDTFKLSCCDICVSPSSSAVGYIIKDKTQRVSCLLGKWGQVCHWSF